MHAHKAYGTKAIKAIFELKNPKQPLLGFVEKITVSGAVKNLDRQAFIKNKLKFIKTIY